MGLNPKNSLEDEGLNVLVHKEYWLFSVTVQ